MRTEPAKNIQGLFEGSPPGRGGPRKTRGLKGGGRSAAVKASQRKRNHGGGRSVKCPEIGYELFQWFVDASRLVKARVGNDILLAKAKQVLHDAEVSVHANLASVRWHVRTP